MNFMLLRRVLTKKKFYGKCKEITFFTYFYGTAQDSHLHLQYFFIDRLG